MQPSRLVTLAGGIAAACLACAGTVDDPSSPASLRSSAESLCQAIDDCEDREADFVSVCVDEFERELMAPAESYGCTDVIAALLDCIETHSTCTPEEGYSHDGACHDEQELAEDCYNGRL